MSHQMTNLGNGAELGVTDRGGQVVVVAHDHHGRSYPQMTPEQALEFSYQVREAAWRAIENRRQQAPCRVFEVVPDGVALMEDAGL